MMNTKRYLAREFSRIVWRNIFDDQVNRVSDNRFLGSFLDLEFLPIVTLQDVIMLIDVMALKYGTTF